MRLLAIPLCTLATALAIAATPASAGTVNIYQQTSSFDGTGTPAGSFGPSKIAIHQATGTVYVLDNQNGVVDKFDSSGNPEDFSAPIPPSPALNGSAATQGPFTSLEAIAVDNSGGPFDGDIYVADRPTLDGRVSAFDSAGNFLYEFDPSGTSTGGFGAALGLAVNSAGSVLVSCFDIDAICKFAPTGSGASVESEISLAELGGNPGDLAIDSGDNVYVNNFGPPAVQNVSKLDPSGAFVSQILAVAQKGLAVNPSTDHFFVDQDSSVAEYDSAGNQVGRFGVGVIGSSQGIAADGGTPGKVYVTDTNSASVRVFARTDVTVPDPTIVAPAPITATSATLNGTVAPLGVPSSYHFEYRIQGDSEWTSTPESSSLDSGGSAQDVSATVVGLEPGTLYEVRLVAANTDAGVANGAIATSNVATFTTNVAAPTFFTSPAALATTNTATLYAALIPHGVGTTYHFEYGTDTSYGTVVPIPDESVGGEPNSYRQPRTVSQTIADLIPNTTYHFRVVATNAAGTSTGADLAFKTLDPNPPGGLPDGRVVEKVSPEDKNGGDVERRSDMHFFHFLYQASTTGNAITWASIGNAGGDSGALVPQYLSRRDSSGWSTRGIGPRLDPKASAPNPVYYMWFSDELSRGLVETSADLHPGDSTNLSNLYLFDSTAPNDSTNSAFSLLSPNPLISKGNTALWGIDASKDLSHILFMSGRPLVTSNGQSQPLDTLGPGLYEWANGELRYVGILPDEKAAPQSMAGTGFISLRFPGYNTISDDGSRIFFTDISTQALYARENGTKTREIAPNIIRFLFAKPSDGSVAFFSKANGGDCNANHGPDIRGCPDLYRWEANAAPGEELTDLTTADPHGGGVLGLLGASDDATKVYFAAIGVLAPGAVQNVPNIYLWEEGKGIRHIAVLSSALTDASCSGDNYIDNGVINSMLWGGDGAKTPESDGRCHSGLGGPPFGGARVTPDGEYLLFDSYGQVTPYDNAGRKQVYLYSLATDQITCISCNTRTAHSMGGAYLNFITEHEAYGDASLFQPRNLSSDGRRIFFDSTEALVPQDTNGKVDVYEWTDGAVHLISSGSSGSNSTFMGASDDGDDVFFGTAEPLVRSDGDPFYDVYDARVGGISEPAPIPSCTGDECQGTPTPPPFFNDPGTSSLSAPGNAPVGTRKKRCGKSKSRSKGRCVRKHHHHAQEHATRGHG